MKPRRRQFDSDPEDQIPYADPEDKKAYYKRRRLRPGVKQKERERNRARHNTLREIVVEAKSVPCLDCRGSYPYYVMDFDHVRGEKLFGIGDLRKVGVSADQLKAEIEKCDVVCANCHRKRTHDRET